MSDMQMVKSCADKLGVGFLLAGMPKEIFNLMNYHRLLFQIG